MVLSNRKNTGFTLVELIVVLTILVILTALVLPRISGVTDQANAGTNTSILQGINEAEARYEAQFRAIPSAWDGVLDDKGDFYSKLHPKILGKTLDNVSGTNTGTNLKVGTLTAMQAQSLIDAGLTGVHFQDSAWTGPASDSGRIYKSVATGLSMMFMDLGSLSLFDKNFDAAGGHNALFSDRAFSIQVFTPMWNNSYIVVGFGNEAGLKRNAVQDTPLFNSAQPENYYARALCVFMVPPGSVTTTTDANYFKARYIGCFAPDGTCQMDNLDNYAKTQKPQ